MELRKKIRIFGFFISKVDYDLLLKSVDFSRLNIEFRLYFFKPVIRGLKKFQLIILNQINEFSFAKLIDFDEFD